MWMRSSRPSHRIAFALLQPFMRMVLPAERVFPERTLSWGLSTPEMSIVQVLNWKKWARIASQRLPELQVAQVLKEHDIDEGDFAQGCEDAYRRVFDLYKGMLEKNAKVCKQRGVESLDVDDDEVESFHNSYPRLIATFSALILDALRAENVFDGEAFNLEEVECARPILAFPSGKTSLFKAIFYTFMGMPASCALESNLASDNPHELCIGVEFITRESTPLSKAFAQKMYGDSSEPEKEAKSSLEADSAGQSTVKPIRRRHLWVFSAVYQDVDKKQLGPFFIKWMAGT